MSRLPYPAEPLTPCTPFAPLILPQKHSINFLNRGTCATTRNGTPLPNHAQKTKSQMNSFIFNIQNAPFTLLNIPLTHSLPTPSSLPPPTSCNMCCGYACRFPTAKETDFRQYSQVSTQLHQLRRSTWPRATFHLLKAVHQPAERTLGNSCSGHICQRAQVALSHLGEEGQYELSKDANKNFIAHLVNNIGAQQWRWIQILDEIKEEKKVLSQVVVDESRQPIQNVNEELHKKLILVSNSHSVLSPTSSNMLLCNPYYMTILLDISAHNQNITSLNSEEFWLLANKLLSHPDIRCSHQLFPMLTLPRGGCKSRS